MRNLFRLRSRMGGTLPPRNDSPPGDTLNRWGGGGGGGGQGTMIKYNLGYNVGGVIFSMGTAILIYDIMRVYKFTCMIQREVEGEEIPRDTLVFVCRLRSSCSMVLFFASPSIYRIVFSTIHIIIT